jgi:hypothetical protein
MYVCMYVCMDVRVYVCMCVCMYVCMYACMCIYVCMYVRKYVCMYACMYVCMYVCTRTYGAPHLRACSSRTRHNNTEPSTTNRMHNSIKNTAKTQVSGAIHTSAGRLVYLQQVIQSQRLGLRLWIHHHFCKVHSLINASREGRVV